MPSAHRLRNLCWTLNNYTEDEIQHIKDVDPSKVKYICYGMEVGENGTPHLQGYAELVSQMSFTTVKPLISARAHIEPRRGSARQAAGYCKKGTDPGPYDQYADRTAEQPGTWVGWEHGHLSHQGRRSDITEPATLIQEGAPMSQIATDFPVEFVKYHKGFRELRSLVLPARSLDAMPEVVVLWGATGTGKTRDAYIKYWPDEPHYVWKPSNGSWWDGYDGQRKIIIDEFRGQMMWCDLLGLLDRNEYRAPYKGGFVQIQADKFVITSPMPPDMWYKKVHTDVFDRYPQLTRRLTEVHHYE